MCSLMLFSQSLALFIWSTHVLYCQSEASNSSISNNSSHSLLVSISEGICVQRAWYYGSLLHSTVPLLILLSIVGMPTHPTPVLVRSIVYLTGQVLVHWLQTLQSILPITRIHIEPMWPHKDASFYCNNWLSIYIFRQSVIFVFVLLCCLYSTV